VDLETLFWDPLISTDQQYKLEGQLCPEKGMGDDVRGCSCTQRKVSEDAEKSTLLDVRLATDHTQSWS
jgi:hypothetical protein